MPEKLMINSLPRDRHVTFLALVREKELRRRRDGGDFLHVVLADRSGEILAKIWENPPKWSAIFAAGDVVKVQGVVELYNEKPQLVIERLRRAKAEEFTENDFYPVSTKDPKEMLGALGQVINYITDPWLRELMKAIIEDPAIRPLLEKAPAGVRIHHCFQGGLLEHIASVCELVFRIKAIYPRRLNLDWMLAGAILHDIGKIEEMDCARHVDFTVRGTLLGHIALGLEILERHVQRIPGFPVRQKTVLQHILISSHQADADKPGLRLPLFPEALVIASVDLLDGRLEQMFSAIDRGPSNEEITSFVPSLGRSVFRGFRPEEPVMAAEERSHCELVARSNGHQTA